MKYLSTLPVLTAVLLMTTTLSAHATDGGTLPDPSPITMSTDTPTAPPPPAVVNGNAGVIVATPTTTGSTDLKADLDAQERNGTLKQENGTTAVTGEVNVTTPPTHGALGGTSAAPLSAGAMGNIAPPNNASGQAQSGALGH